MTIYEKINSIVKTNNSLVCVGLDSEFSKLPEAVKNSENPQFEFNKAIIEATHDLVAAYKPNSAFYEARGEQGVKELKMTCDYLVENYPEIVIILDAKRADIGNTNNGYVNFAFNYLRVDAITLHPYLGEEALRPFLDRADKGAIILARTSNPGAGEFQDLEMAGEKLFMIVARKVNETWNKNNNCLLVVGATYPEELAEVRKAAPKMYFLVPGIGAQGGDVEKTLNAGLNADKNGLLINSSRGIIFASVNDDFAEVARVETMKLKDEINKYRK